MPKEQKFFSLTYNKIISPILMLTRYTCAMLLYKLYIYDIEKKTPWLAQKRIKHRTKHKKRKKEILFSDLFANISCLLHLGLLFPTI